MRDLIFIHGAGNDGSIWNDVKKQFVETKDYKIHTPDLPGHADQHGECDSIDAYSNWITDYINKNNLTNVVLIGHSMGGAIAIVSASKSDRIKAVAIIGSGLKLPVSSKILNGLKDYPMQTIETIAKWSFSFSASTEQKNKAVQMMEKNKKSLYNDFLACRNYDGHTAAEQIKIPVLVVVGDSDVMTPAELSEELANRFNAAVFKIKNSGHMAQIENPEMHFTAINSFISENSSANP